MTLKLVLSQVRVDGIYVYIDKLKSFFQFSKNQDYLIEIHSYAIKNPAKKKNTHTYNEFFGVMKS